MSFRVAFDGRALTSPAGGVRRYAQELFAAIARVDPDVQLTAIGGARLSVPHRARHIDAGWSLPSNLGWCLTGLPRAARREPFDVFHSPAYTAPLWGVRPLVVTVHDVSYARHPEWYPYRLDPIRRAFYRQSVVTADRVLTDSTFSRDEIVAAYAIDPDRIEVVPLGVGPPFCRDARVGREMFVLHVGDLHPRRNLPMLFDAVLALRRADPRCAGLRLVVAGTDRGELDGLRRQAQGAEGALDYVGCPDDLAIADLYRRAAVFAYPSRYEGFGLPLLEAMACGTPVVAAAAGSIPEVVGDAARLVNSGAAGPWTEALHAVLTDATEAASWTAAGQARAAEFTWERTARETLACYRQTVAETQRGA